MKKIIVVLAIVLLAGCRSIESPVDQRDGLKVKSEDTEKATETEKLVSEKEKLAEDKSSEEIDKLKEGKERLQKEKEDLEAEIQEKKKEREAELERAKAEEEEALARINKAEAEAEAIKRSASDSNILDNYTTLEIEYARILLMTNGVDPSSEIIYVYYLPAGTAVDPAGMVTYPMDVTVLLGEYGYQGMFVYGSHGDGHITIYNTPRLWGMFEDSSDEGLARIAREVVNSAVTVYVDPGDPYEVADKIDSVYFIYY